VVGTEAAKVAIGMGAEVTVVDVNLERLAELETILHHQARLLYSQPAVVAHALTQADLVIGAVLVAGGRAPTLVKKETIASMRTGAVIIDVAVDQGGCIETIRPTSHTAPTYLVDGVLHCGIPNLPGAVARSATQALVNATFPFVRDLALYGKDALHQNPDFAKGINLDGGKLIHPEVIKAFPDLV
jgi:alanine dehydrogenase